MRIAHSDTPTVHRFAAGHIVRLGRTTPFHNAAEGDYEVTAQLPERDGEFQYCIKSDREPYERIVREGELETGLNSSQTPFSSGRAAHDGPHLKPCSLNSKHSRQ